MAWHKTLDGSIEDHTGKVIFFSTDRFVNDICLGRCCFICGAQPGSKIFNDEHVFPDWLLRKFSLFDRTITLPNGRTLRYDRNKIPCCQDANGASPNLCGVLEILERAKGFEPSTPTLARSCSTPELHPHPLDIWPIWHYRPPSPNL